MSYLKTHAPTGVDVGQRHGMKPAFGENLLEHVLQPANLQQAWQRVRANKGAAGVDGMTIDDFPAWAKSGKCCVWHYQQRAMAQCENSGD
ncbi:hypothetical protein [Thalassomonas haliotis]|uniref:Uncharacterized protein n=1 Tax=Thalassomonas haliotis TaxID=485448 RepID=A0ABY7V8K4_9GAMM|nr:hypothetical protein [Thalassomonas haliotis]WDE09369.1 hypothetical protein H3N35_13585 [Thalassomonas haliotis]